MLTGALFTIARKWEQPKYQSGKDQFSSVQFSHSLSPVRLFATPWTAAGQSSLSITNSQSLLKHMFIELVMPSNHPIFCRPFSSCLQSFLALQFFFAFCHKGSVICISEVTDISPGNLDSSLCFILSGISHDVLCIEVK